MQTDIAQKLDEAYEVKKNDLNSYVWKLAKENHDGQTIQKEIKLMDASEGDLNKFYSHCKSMLYNEDNVNPGRCVLLDIINDQITNCNTELFIRYIENTYKHSDRSSTPRFIYLQSLREALKNNNINKELQATIPISATTQNIPEEFCNIPIDKVVDGCLDNLGIFNKKHLTLSFILKMGIWLTKDELKEFNDSEGGAKERLSRIKERLGLRNNVILHNTPTGLTFSELRAMVQLKTKKYSEMTTDQLIVLRNKVLFMFYDEVNRHAEQWLERMSQIQRVAEKRGIQLAE